MRQRLNHMVPGQLAYDDVRRIWLAAGGKDTGGIVQWFAPPITTSWREETVRADEVGALRLIGGDPAGRFDCLTGGTYRVCDGEPAAPEPQFEWDDEWVLVAVRDPETGERALIDGNERALQLQSAIASGLVLPNRTIRLMTGDLDLRVVRIAKAVSSLWR